MIQQLHIPARRKAGLLCLAASGLIVASYAATQVLPRIFAYNDTLHTWEFTAASAADYTYNPALVTVDNDGARPAAGTNKFTNASFTADNSSWQTAALPPDGWIEVPGNGSYSTQDFLVMKYEAKCAAISNPTVGLTSPVSDNDNNAGNGTYQTYCNDGDANCVGEVGSGGDTCTAANNRQVVSVASGYPIARISQIDSATYCTTVAVGGTTAHLITNNEWMTIARNAEQRSQNWTTGTVGSGSLFRGHTDNSPASALVASANDADGYLGTGNSAGSSPEQKRTIALSNNAIIWDFPGNVWEWNNNTVQRKDQPVAWNGSVDDTSGFNWSDYASGSLTRYIHTYKPGSVIQQATVGSSNLAWNANQGIGRIYHYSDPNDTNTTTYGFLRGGRWSDGASAGLFSLDLSSTPAYRANYLGFRCASDPVEISHSYTSDSGYHGGGDAVTVGTLTDAKIFQTVNVGSADTFALSAVVYNTTTGSVGGTIDSSVASLYANGQAVSTTYTDLGEGWWKLSATLAGANENREYGLTVKAGKTVVIDDLTLNRAETYSVFTTTAYSNGQVSSWDSFTDSVTADGDAAVRYQFCTDDGAACESGNSWQYWDGDSWETATNATTHSNSVDQLTQDAMQALPVVSQKIAVKAIFSFAGDDMPTLDSFTVGLTTDVTPPPVNASNLTMKRSVTGTDVNTNDWTNNLAPYFSWTAGADDVGGAGLRGYCLYLGQDENGDPATSKGLLGTSPGSLAGSDCQFVVTSTSIDFATLSYRGPTWLSSSNDPYYLNVKAVDIGGNVYTGSPASFQFRFDNSSPTNVAYISPAAGNFSNVVDMNFSWPTTGSPAATDAQSGILGWQYRINTTSGPWLGTTTDSTLGLTYIPVGQSSYTLTQEQDGDAIVSGNNVIYFRSVDTAGNVSSDATIRTGNLSYGGAAPAFENAAAVTVTPDTATTNSFAVSWPEAQATIGQQVAGYYYMVNTLPPSTYATLTSNPTTYIPVGNVTSLSARSLTGVNKGSNTIYVVAVDNAETPNYSPSNYITGTFTLNSTDPDNVGNLVASDSSIKSQSQWNVTLTWTAPAYQGAGNLSYLIYRSSDGNTFSQVGTTTGLSYVDNTPDSTQYYYKIYTKDGANAQSSGSNSVTITPTGKWTSSPTLESGPTVTNITTKKATISWTTNRSSDSKVAFGTKSEEYFKEEPSNSDQVTNHTINLTNLNPGTRYYYKVKWTDEDGNTGESEEKNFSTQPAPTVKDVAAKNVGLSSAIITFTSNGASKVKIYYGKSTDFGGMKEVSTATGEETYTAELTGLEDGTKYYYKINAFDSESSEYEGTILDFTTLPRPRISNVRLEQVANTAQTTIRVTWTTNTEVSSVITFYPEENPSASRDEVKVALEKGAHTMVISGLLPETSYQLLVKGRDKLGNEAVSDLQRFTTATDTRPPQILNLKVIGGTVPPVGFAAGDIRAQLVVSWDTDEPASSQVEFGEGTGTAYAQKSQEDGNLATNHTVILSNLTPSQVYHLRAISKDAQGNETRSVDTVTIAPKATRSALDLVVRNLSEAFSFLSALGVR